MIAEDKDLLMRRVAAYCAVIVVVGFFVIMGMLLFVKVPPENKDTLNQMLGALILAFGGLMGYLYGSSKNSEAQSRAITTMAVGAPPVDPAPPDEPVPVVVQNTEPVDVAVVPASKTAPAKKRARR